MVTTQAKMAGGGGDDRVSGGTSDGDSGGNGSGVR